MPQVERLVAFARQMLFGSSFDYTRIGAPPGAGETTIGYGLNQLPPPLRELLWGEWRRWRGVCGA